MDDDTRLIEKIMPITEISEESAKEKQPANSTFSLIHVWWARRPLVSCRAAIFGALTRFPDNKNARENIAKQMIELCKWENTNKQSIIYSAREKIIDDNHGKIPKVLDLFAGGGAIPLEAMRLGCDAYAVDLNPVAHLIQLGTLVYPSEFSKSNKSTIDTIKVSSNDSFSEELGLIGKKIADEMKKDFGHFYPTEENGNKIIAYLWARTVKCPNPKCGIVIPLVLQYTLSNKSGRKVCLKLNIKKNEHRVEFEIIGQDKEIDSVEGTMRKGKCTCPACGTVGDGIYLRKESCAGRMGQQMICVVTSGKDGRGYRKPNQKDLDAYKKAEQELDKIKSKKINRLPIIPDELLPERGTLGFRVQAYGFKHWSDLLNKRQQLFFAKYLEYRDVKYPLYFGFSLDKLAAFNCSFARWVPLNQQVKHIFARQAIPMMWDYAEVNPISDSSGSIIAAWKDVEKTIRFVSAIDMKPAKVVLGSATSTPFNDREFDAVITDPPYYDAIGYADLSDFFYVWLKRSIGDKFPDVFKTVLTPKSEEIIQTPVRHEGDSDKAKSFYENQMTLAFKEICRVLKDNGIVVIVFAHKSTSAWETLINSLLDANLVVTASWPLKTEQENRIRGQNNASLASSFFIVCRKRKEFEDGFYEDVKNELKKTIKERLDYFWSQKVSGSDFFISAIGPAISVFGKYKTVRKLSGEAVSVSEFLSLTRQLVSEYALQQILHGEKLGNIDDYTRFYVIWRWSYDGYEIGFDDARMLAQALGAEPDELMGKEGLLKKNKDKVILLGAKERKHLKNLGEPVGGVKPPIIDILHKACVLWEEGNRSELEDYLAEGGYGKDEGFWAVAQAIAEVLPEGDKEKQLLQGLLVSRSKLSGDAKQQKLI